MSVIFGSGAVHVPHKQLLVGRGDFAKLFLGHLVLVDVGGVLLVGVFVWVPLQCQLSICIFNLLVGSRLLNA